MHRWVIGLGVAALLLHSAANEAAAQGKNDAPGWLKDYNQAKLAAKQSGKPMFLVFR